ncbi:hypothetical protein [Promicromonospora sp. NPDC057488]|uniref:hypothetical protein n=1 Tax=Promicromonospora sp. NPDC057488 TaxID=3346147 RepID=UPI003671D27B
MSTTEQMTPAEHAALVRDAITLVNAVETGITRTGAVFASASALTVANLALGLHPVAQVLAAVAALAFLAAVVLVVTRIALGPAPEPLPEVATGVAQVAERPATGSAPATPENGGISTK